MSAVIFYIILTTSDNVNFDVPNRREQLIEIVWFPGEIDGEIIVMLAIFRDIRYNDSI